jgi:hypothetical protein
VAELEQLALNSLVSPALILPGHALDQHAHTVTDGWTTDAVRVSPLLGHQATMPAQDRARRDQAMLPQHPGQSSDQRGEHRDPPNLSGAWGWLCAARRLHDAAPGARHLWTPTSDRATTTGSEAAERSDTADAPTRHTIMPRPPSTPITRSEPQADFWNPTRPQISVMDDQFGTHRPDRPPAVAARELCSVATSMCCAKR